MELLVGKSLLISFLVLLTCCIQYGSAHGYMRDPPGRSTIWREKDMYPPEIKDQIKTNYDDNGLNCGGRGHQWERVNGRCGVCGDKWTRENEIREHEAGGYYAKGIIVRNYMSGDVINVTLHVTAAHRGYFEFRICPVNNVTIRANQTCLDKNLLAQPNGNTRFYYGNRAGFYDVPLMLPHNLTCSQCVLQWKYRAGNSWGNDTEGTGLGFGPQEEFYNCADVSIYDDSQPSDVTTVASNEQTATDQGRVTTEQGRVTTEQGRVTTEQGRVTTEQGRVTTEQGRVTTEQGRVTTKQWHVTTEQGRVTTEQERVTTEPGHVTTEQERVTTEQTQATTTTVNQPKCRAAGAYRNVPNMGIWCIRNCAAGFCPRTHCDCSGKPDPGPNLKNCITISLLATDKWCHDNCNHNPAFCPPDFCRCI